MLIEFSVTNFRSISEKVTLTMIPATGKSKIYNIIPIEKNSNVKKLLKSCVIYGANGSGKTNILRAIDEMRDMVLLSKQQNKGQSFSEYHPFLLNKTYSNMPITFEISFIKENTEYHYKFTFSKNKILNEELSYFKSKKEIFIFKRDTDKIEPFKDWADLKKLFEFTGENVLFLSKANNEYKPFGPVYEWFKDNLTSIGPLSALSQKLTINYMNESDENKQKIIKFMKFADFNIEGIQGKNHSFTDLSSMKDILKNSGGVNITAVMNDEIDKHLTFEAQELQSIRKRVDDNSEISVNFNSFESEGTNQFFKLASTWLESIYEKDKVIIIDEFDIQLHPDLQYYLLKIFHDPEINKTKSQLVFSTHNVKILSTDFFRREQILFTEKNSKTQSTTLYSLYDFEKRDDKSIEKGYQLGRYGGIPNIRYGKI